MWPDVGCWFENINKAYLQMPVVLLDPPFTYTLPTILYWPENTVECLYKLRKTQTSDMLTAGPRWLASSPLYSLVIKNINGLQAGPSANRLYTPTFIQTNFNDFFLLQLILYLTCLIILWGWHTTFN